MATVAGTPVSEEQANLLASSGGRVHPLPDSYDYDRKLDALLVKIDALADAAERTATSLQAVVWLAAAQVAWGLQDRLTGSWTVTNAEWMVGFYELVIKNSPMLWCVMAMCRWAIVALALNKFMDRANATRRSALRTEVAAVFARTSTGAMEL